MSLTTYIWEKTRLDFETLSNSRLEGSETVCAFLSNEH